MELVYGGGSPGAPTWNGGGVAVDCGVNEGKGVTTTGVFWMSVGGKVWNIAVELVKA
jgi:hypothetical protein